MEVLIYLKEAALALIKYLLFYCYSTYFVFVVNQLCISAVDKLEAISSLTVFCFGIQNE